MVDKFKFLFKKYLLEFLLFYFFYLASLYLLKGKTNFFEIFKFLSSLSLFLILKINEDEKEKEYIPFLLLFSFLSILILFKNFYLFKKFSFLFLFFSFFFKYEKIKYYLKENFILKDILYSFLYLYLLFFLYPFKFPFYPEVFSIFFGFFIINFLKFFSEKIRFSFEEKLGTMTYSKFMGFYTSIFFLLIFYFSSFFIFLSFWEGLYFSFIFPLVLLFSFLKVMLFIFLRIFKKQEGFYLFLKNEANFYKYGVYIAFIIEGIIKFLKLQI